MLEPEDRGGFIEEGATFDGVLRVLVVEVGAVLGVEIGVEGDVVVTC